MSIKILYFVKPRFINSVLMIHPTSGHSHFYPNVMNVQDFVFEANFVDSII